MYAVFMCLYLVLAMICFICSLYSDNLCFDIGLFGFMILSGIEKICMKLEGLK